MFKRNISACRSTVRLDVHHTVGKLLITISCMSGTIILTCRHVNGNENIRIEHTHIRQHVIPITPINFK